MDEELGVLRDEVVQMLEIVTLHLSTSSSVKSYDIPRQHIKKQRHYFAKKDPYSQSFGFSNSHIQM